MMQGAVTNQHYARFIAAGGYRHKQYWSDMGQRWLKSKRDLLPAFLKDAQFNHPEQPIVGLSWYEALAYANWLSSTSEHTWRLPSEVEWEVAAQSPHTGKIHSAASSKPYPLFVIGEGNQSQEGIWNLLGNVWEWCSSRWGRNWQRLDYAYPYQADDGREDLAGSHARVIRGGSWYDPMQEAHPSKRARYLPGSRASNIGFRLVHSM